MPSRSIAPVAALLGLIAVGAPAACRMGPAPSSPLTLEQVAGNNRGVGLMGRFDYAEAAKAFDEVAGARPEALDAQVNLAIALLNQQGPNELARSERVLRERVLAIDAGHRRGRYVLALLLLNDGRTTEALPHFRAVADADPPDAFAAYFAARCLAADQPEEALAWYRKAIALDPRLRSAYYGAFQALQRLQRGEDGRDLLQRFEDLDRDPQATVAEFKYLRMGPLATAITIDRDRTVTTPPAPAGRVFATATPLITAAFPWRSDASAGPVSITAADLDGDGRLDVFAAGAGTKATPNALMTGQADGSFQPQPDHPLASVTAVRAALWGDYDNDGLVDVFLGRSQGGSQLWRQVTAGSWRDVTRAAGIVAPEAAVDGALFDADHDGDLDIVLLSAGGPLRLLNNNGDGTFRNIAPAAGLAGNDRGARSLAIADLDADRDADLIVVRQSPPHDVYINDRLWQYHRASGTDAFANAAIEAVLAGDTDANGDTELYTDGPRGIERWTRDRQQAWQPQRLAASETRAAGPNRAARQLALTDVDGDGTLDLIASRGSAWAVIDPASAESRSLPVTVAEPAVEAWTVGLFDPARGPSVIGLSSAGAAVVWGPGPGRHPFLALAMSGRDRKSDQLRSNLSGIGASVAVRTGSRWTALNTWRWQSGPGQGLQPFALGLGGAAEADFLAVTWSDGVFQTELSLAAGAVHRVEETQRQLSSCPVLFAFNGRTFGFVTDVLGVGGIGFLERPGVYSEPFPNERVLLPIGSLVPKDGRYQVKIGEPMEEITYLDTASLSVYDLPPGWQMTLDERKSITGSQPTGEPRFFARDLVPSRATTLAGEDVTPAITTADGVAAPVGTPDRRFIGRTALSRVTLEFDRPIDAGGASPLLVIDGWIEYPYAQTIFAAWQANAPYRAPSIEARDHDGRWHMVLKEFGYPAGMPRQMSVPLTGLPRGTTALRVSTTQEIYWDRIAIAFPESVPAVRHQRMPVSAARLDEVGFPQRTTGPQRRPHYDYDRRSPLLDTRHPRGWYTAIGAVEPLVASADDAVAIFGPGEEVHLEFDAPPPPPPGWTRRIVLEVRGWCKDMDLYTRDGDTVAPLPGRASPRREALHSRFNTRYEAGR